MVKRRCVIIGSSPETDIDVIRKHLREGDFIACADGGYVYAEQLGIKPDMIIGDFDSSERPDTDICRIIENRNGCGFAVFPFGCESCNVSLEGFEYNLQAGTLTADFPLGVSNTIRSDKAKITVHNGMAVAMCNVQCAMCNDDVGEFVHIVNQNP